MKIPGAITEDPYVIKSDPSVLIPAGPLRGLPEQLKQFENYLGQMARILDAQQRRIDALEKDNAMRITISHQQAKSLQGKMRERAGQICARYTLDARLHGAAIRGAIKKAVLREWGIRDLHDLPLGCFQQAGEQIAAFSDFALVQKRRRIEREMEQNGHDGA